MPSRHLSLNTIQTKLRKSMLLIQQIQKQGFSQTLLRNTQEELNMAQDVTWKSYFSDDERYADIINGIGCGGKQLIAKDDLQELDTQTWFLRKPQFIRKIRERKVGHK